MLNVLFEDNHIIVVAKQQNVPTQEDSSKDMDLLTMVKNYIKESRNKQGNVYVGLVHRLDRPTGGVMVFALTSKAASRLTEQIKNGEFEKTYFTVVCGKLKNNSGKLINYVKKNEETNIVTVVPQGVKDAKYAELAYTVLQEQKNLSLVSVNLITGRSHQIRVQFAHINAAVFGDAKYNINHKKGMALALYAVKLKFIHPTTKKILTFKIFPPLENEPWKNFNVNKFLS